jgi:hypothetical protein
MYGRQLGSYPETGLGDINGYKGDFAARTLRLLKLARAAVIYLSLAVWSEERKRDRDSGRKTTLTMPLDVLGG